MPRTSQFVVLSLTDEKKHQVKLCIHRSCLKMTPNQGRGPASASGPTGKEAFWDRALRPRRPAITDDGFDMPGFVGHYYMWPEEYWLLAKYVELTEGDYLEIGSMCGIIAMSFAEKYPRRKFVCVDNFSPGHATIAGNKEAFLQNLHNHSPNNVTLIEGNSLEVVPKLSRPFEIILIDGNHAYDFVLGDALNSWRLLLPGGYLAFHDYDCVPETTRAVEDFLKQSGGRLVETATCLAVVRKPTEAERRQQEQHQEQTSTLLRALEAAEQKQGQLQARVDDLTVELEKSRKEKRELEALWQGVENSAGWRILNSWRKVRNALAPSGTRRRRAYDNALRHLRGSP